MVFGKEKDFRDYILLAAASKDGSVVIYRCYRSETEKKMFDQEQVSLLLSSSKPGDADPHKQRDALQGGGGKEGEEAGGSGNKCRGPFVSVHSRLVWKYCMAEHRCSNS